MGAASSWLRFSTPGLQNHCEWEFLGPNSEKPPSNGTRVRPPIKSQLLPHGIENTRIRIGFWRLHFMQIGPPTPHKSPRPIPLPSHSQYYYKGPGVVATWTLPWHYIWYIYIYIHAQFAKYIFIYILLLHIQYANSISNASIYLYLYNNIIYIC